MRILIIKLGALGDVIIAMPHIQQIIHHYQAHEVWLLTAPEYGSLFSEFNHLRMQTFPRKGLRSVADPIRWVRSKSFDVVMDLQGSDRSKMMVSLSGAKKKAGLGPGFPYTHFPENKGIIDGEVHSFHRLNRLLEAAHIPIALDDPHLQGSSTDKQKVADWLKQQGISEQKIVLIHAGSSARWESKRWTTNHFITLATILTEQYGLAVIWLGGKEDIEINQKLVQFAGIDATGLFSLLELAELARYTYFAITTDSAPMHIIAATGAPVYALFGPTDWQRSHAVGQKERVLTHSVECSPCFIPQCPPEQGHKCLVDLKPEMVLNRLKQDGFLT
ncbi:glycosyltransferase family 9 protein [Candidatus Nitrosacidococcus tergens]|uniref:Glycosyl transferase family 9 n=1 Tax=Candidatus Nitrosacidococcus tergens TaxID=553981 RepID=A0A7G1QAW5_9GAMM|nr:glycosyltransferase family 9 protein [Candidatus Nitrosacidococcus tergens]CAB1276845.1 Glycosyl transferase family 9 [Candidatus Nitrosacidococcus tergens]